MVDAHAEADTLREELGRSRGLVWELKRELARVTAERDLARTERDTAREERDVARRARMAAMVLHCATADRFAVLERAFESVVADDVANDTASH